MEATAEKKLNKNLKPRTINGELSRHNDMLRTHYPKICPTYLVAFSLKETYDDLVTAQQMICNRSTPEHSPQESINSITPTGSFKILETVLEKSNVNAKNKRLTPGNSPKESRNSIRPTESFKILETEPDKCDYNAKNKHSISEYSPKESTNSITPSGSFKMLDTEIDKSKLYAKNKLSTPEYSPQESTNSIRPTGFKKLEIELEKSNVTAKNKHLTPGHSPLVNMNSITPTGSFKMLDTELDKSKLNVKNNTADNPGSKNNPDSITPTNYFKVLETKPNGESSQITDKNNFETNPVNMQNSPHASIYSTNSSMATSSLKCTSSDYSNASMVTIGEKQKLTIDFTAFETNSDDTITTKSSDITENTPKCDVIAQDSIKVKVVPKDNKEVSDHVKEKREEYITVYVYEKSDNTNHTYYTSDSDNTKTFNVSSNAVNTSNTDNRDDNKSYNKINGVVADKINDTHENWKNNKKIERIFKSVKKNCILNKGRALKRNSNNAVNKKQRNIKCKLSKKKINVRLEKYYEKVNNSIDAYKIQIDLYSDEMSTVVSRTRVLHKIKAKENLLEKSDLNTDPRYCDDVISLTSSHSTARKTLMSVSDSSQNTLVQEVSMISNVTDILDMNKKNQDIEVEHVSSLLKIPTVNDIYKSEVVSIPVTVAYDRLTVSELKTEKNLTSQDTSEENCTPVKLPLTSCEDVLPFISNVVSQKNEPSFDDVTIKPSTNTFINTMSSFASNDDFYNARTSSQFSKCMDSFSTLTNDKDIFIDVESTIEESILNKEAMIFKTVINLDRCDESPSTSSTSPSSHNKHYFNDVIVANVPNDNFSTNLNNSDNKEKENNWKTILNKTTKQSAEDVPKKFVNLPNQLEIKAMLREREMPQLKCGDEMRNPPIMPPLWERLMAALEMAVHRLEDNLVEKIMKEIQKSIVKYPEPESPSSESTTKADEGTIKPVYENLSVQCDLVKNTTIDKIMGILSNDGTKIKDPNTLHKVDLYNDIEVIISPNTTRAMTVKGDQVSISPLASVSHKLLHRLILLASVPVRFIRENMLVITSVPTFFVFLLCIYGLIQFLMKPLW